MLASLAALAHARSESVGCYVAGFGFFGYPRPTKVVTVSGLGHMAASMK